MSTASLETLREACGATLRQWPDGLAAVLFGSRARGTHRPDSDWDIALVSRSESQLPDGIPLRELDGVDVWVLPESDLRQRANALGSLAFEVARDGRLIAGRWKRPQTEGIRVSIDVKVWKSNMGQALDDVHAAAASLDRVAWKEALDEAARACGRFVSCSADSAEFLGKAALVRRLVQPESTHNLDRLAKELENARPEHAAMAARLRELNGDTSRHHLGPYAEVEVKPGDCIRAGTRLAATLALWIDEIEGVFANATLEDPALEAVAHALTREASSAAPRILALFAGAYRSDYPEEGTGDERDVVEAAMATVSNLLPVVRDFAERAEGHAASD